MRILSRLSVATLAITASLVSLASPSPAQMMEPNSPSSPSSPEPQQSSPPPPTTTEITFTDISGNVYKPEILEAASLKIIQGFPDGTFRPKQAVTREQAISMIVDALNTVVPIDVNEKPTRRARPYLDIKPDRWSAAKINWAQWNFSVLQAGTYTGNFRPTDPIKRSTLINFLRSAAENLKLKLGRTSSYLNPTQKPVVFSDVAGIDKQLTEQMSAYCGIASPLNEKGNKFAPDQPAARDYTAAAIVRTLKCVKNDKK